MASTYITTQGDMWDYVAYKAMGSQRYTDLLINANPQYKDVAVLPGNIKLVIPDVDTPRPSSLPPWKR